MQIHDIIGSDWLGTAEQIQCVEQFARDYPWEEQIDDPEFAADEVIGRLGAEIALHPEAEHRLHAALVASAENVG